MSTALAPSVMNDEQIVTLDQVQRQILARAVLNPETGCMEFLGYLNRGGYGVVRMARRTLLAHRVVWMAHHGPIPDGFEMCHTCDNRKCVSIAHLSIGTRLDNQRDMYRKGRGRKACGESHPRAKLTADQVRELRRVYAAADRSRYHHEMSYDYFATLFGMAKSSIAAIISGSKWRSVS